MDWPWTVSRKSKGYDGLKHRSYVLTTVSIRKKRQQERGVAKILGLDSYFQFCKWMPLVELPDESVDVLWCDFGVGSRMKILPPVPGADLRPGGFLLCHSTHQTKAPVIGSRLYGIDKG
jgi:hypothetical protein